MATTEAFSGSIQSNVSATMTFTGDTTGSQQYQLNDTETLTDGTNSNQGTAALKGSLTVGTGTITLSLADSADPFDTGGDAVPSADPEGKEMMTIKVKNNHASAVVTLRAAAGTGVLGLFEALGDGILIGPGGHFLWHAPTGTTGTGGSDLADGARDELEITSDTVSTGVDIIVLYQ